MRRATKWLQKVYQEMIEKSFLFVLILLAINIITKILFLDSESMWLDEASTINWSMHSFSHILKASLQDPNGPVFQILLKVWISFFGISEFAARLLPAIFGSLVIWPLYLLGRDLFDKQVAIVAVLLCTVSNELIFWSHEVRSYTLVVFLAVWSFYFFFRIINNGRKLDVIWYWLISSILVFTHLTATMVIVVQFLASFMFLKSKFKHVLFSYAGMALTTIGFGIWILNNNWIGGGETVWAPVPNFQSIIELLATYLNATKVMYFAAISLIVFILAISLFKIEFSKSKGLVTVLLWGLLPIVITYFGSIYYNPRFLTKYMLYVVPGLYLSLSVVAVYLFQKKSLSVVFSLIVILLMSYFVNLNPEKSEKWRQAVSYYNKYKDPNTIAFLCAPYQSLTFSYYYNIDIFKDYENIEQRLLEDGMYLLCALDDINEVIEKDTLATRMILLLSHDGMYDPNDGALKYFKETYFMVNSVTNLHGIRIFVFDLTEAPHETEPDYITDSIAIQEKTYNDIFVKQLKDFDKNPFTSFKLSCILETPEQLEGHLVFSTRGKNERNVWDGFDLAQVVPNEPYQYEKTFFIPDNFADGSDIAIYIWQTGEKQEFVVKDVKVWVD